MPIKRNAKKALRQSVKRAARNAQRLANMNYAMKMVKLAIKDKNVDAARKALVEAQQKLDKAAQKKSIKPNTASRRLSRLTKAINKIEK